MRALVIAPAVALVLACASRPIANDDSASDSSGSAGSAGSSGTTESGDPSEDEDCQPILQADGLPTGFEQCMAEDVIVRTGSATCTSPQPPSHECGAGYGVCSNDADCTDAPYGSCGYPGDITAACHCEYGCMNDADCEPGLVCMCAPVDAGTHCIEAECQTDADCTQGYRCALSPSDSWGSPMWPSLHCHSAADLCQGDADCPDGLCRWMDWRWQCSG